MAIKEGAKRLKTFTEMLANDESFGASDSVTGSGSFKLLKTGYNSSIKIISYATVIAEIIKEGDGNILLCVKYSYHGGTPTTQRVIRAICDELHIDCHAWERDAVFELSI